MAKGPLKILLLVLLSVLSAWGCSKKTENDLLKEAVQEAVRAAEAKDAPAFMRLVSKDYSDDRGNDYNGIKGMLFYQLMRPGSVKVFVRSLDIEIKGSDALAGARVAVIRGKDAKSLGDIVPQEADILRFDVIFRKEDGRWKAIGANWVSTGPAGLL